MCVCVCMQLECILGDVAAPCVHRRRLVWGSSNVDCFRIASTCLFLAGKVEEMPVPINTVVVKAYTMQHQKRSGPDPASKEFWELREQILVCEHILLQALNFDLNVQHPYRPLMAYVKSIKNDLVQVGAKPEDLTQVAWNFINDSLRTTIALHSTPQCVAAAAVYLASRFLGVTVPTRYEVIKVPQAEFEAVAEQILAYYRLTDPDGEDPLERKQRRHQSVRRRLRHYTQQHTVCPCHGIHILAGTCVPRCVVWCRRRRKRVPGTCSSHSCGAGPDADPRTVYCYNFARRPARGGRALARPKATKAARRLTRHRYGFSDCEPLLRSRSIGEARRVSRVAGQMRHL